MALVTEQGYKPSEAARSLGIGDNLIRRWEREFEEAASGVQLGTDEREKLKRLRKEVRMLRMEKENARLKRLQVVTVLDKEALEVALQ